jgi:sodium-independent sulfate anion transporter 11
LQQANNGEGSSSGENSTRTSSYEEKLDSSRNSFVAGELEGGLGSSVSLPLLDRATPFFHFDLADALNAVQHGSRS